ncbi:SPOR domain-containing protein [Marinomonas sp. THO17]|uniref:SPOR domain-containing protein n=1 Tax=Marinomonas sp. THO17 TaxID=3149048 RepID=UPI00336C00F2
MGIIKKLIVIQMGFVLAACSSTGGLNTFMTYEDLQKKVKAHDEQWQEAQVKLDRIDALEAEVASLKQERLAMEAANEMPVTSQSTVIAADDSMAATNVAPMVMESSVAEETPMMDATAMSATETSSTDNMASESAVAPAPIMAAPLTANTMTADKTMQKPVEQKMSNDSYGVQLAAYSKRDEAMRGWQLLLDRDPVSYQGLQPKINQKEVKGRTMYQLKVGPFLQKSFSTDFCMMLKEKGKDCMVTQFNGEAF